MVGLLTGAIGDLILVLGGVTSSRFPSLGLISSFLLGDSLIMMGTSVGVCGFPCPILELLMVLKYMGYSPYCFLLGLTGVPIVANVAATSSSKYPRDRLV